MSEPFHSYDGWQWSRLWDGSVRIELREQGRALFSHVVSDDVWASIVAAVSLSGSSSAQHEAAYRLHSSPEP